MKRFHIHIGVEDLAKSVQFYSTLFGHAPVKLKEDYAKWLLDDPKLNFAISTRSSEKGLNHLGIQVDDNLELTQITERLKKADLGVFDEGEVTCCYAKSNKAWVTDPAGIPWEAYQNMADAQVFSEEPKTEEAPACSMPSKEPTGCCG